MNRQPTSEDFLGPPPTHETLFAETFLSDNNQASTPTLTEAILEPDSFLKSFALPEDSSKDNHCSGSTTNTFQLDLCKMDIDNINNSDCVMRGVPHSVSGGSLASHHGPTSITYPYGTTGIIGHLSGTAVATVTTVASGSISTASPTIPIPTSSYKTSPNCTPTNISPVVTPKTSSPDHQLSKLTDLKFIDQYVGQRLMEEKTRTNTYGGMPSARPVGGAFRHFFNGLDTIPEYQVTDPPSTFQPLVPPPVPVPKVATTSYNISFPTTLQPRDRFDIWRSGHSSALSNNSARFSSGTGSSCSSVPQSPGSSIASPFHDAKASNPYDVSEYQPLNVIEGGATSDSGSSRKSSSGYSSRSSSGGAKPKASKRSRTNSPHNREDDNLNDGASSRIRRKSNSSQSTSVASTSTTSGSTSGTSNTSSGNSNSESKRRDSIKYGLEELQRALPQFGTPEEEKISHATILCEAAKYLKSLKQSQDGGDVNLESLNLEIEEMNKEIEHLQNKLPDNGAVFGMNHDTNSLVAVKRSLPDQFADHVVERTHQNWKYWVFTSIMGHFVHSFAQEVSNASQHDFETTSIEWITNSMSLQQLRKDVSRKLAKLNAKTSNFESTSTHDALRQLANTKVRPKYQKRP